MEGAIKNTNHYQMGMMTIRCSSTVGAGSLVKWVAWWEDVADTDGTYVAQDRRAKISTALVVGSDSHFCRSNRWFFRRAALVYSLRNPKDAILVSGVRGPEK